MVFPFSWTTNKVMQLEQGQVININISLPHPTIDKRRININLKDLCSIKLKRGNAKEP